VRRSRNESFRVSRFDEGELHFAIVSFPTIIEKSLPSNLTEAERQVATLLIQGLSNADIAESRRTSSRTVANQVESIYRKTGVRSRAEFVKLAAAQSEKEN
jgi:DNA-binding NarL/FixJ family response regulator